MKKKGFVLLMMVFLLLSVLPASAAEQRVFDNADLLTAEEEQNLQQFCEDAKEEYDIDFAYLTTKDTEGLSTREYGAQFYIEQNLGVGEDYSGAIFVLDMGEREGQLVTCGEAMEMITDADADAIWDEISSYFSNGDYYGGMEQLWWDVDSLCADYQTYGAEGRPKSDAFFSESPVSSGGGIAMIILLAAAFSAVIAGVSVMSMRKACKNVHPFTDGRAAVICGRIRIPLQIRIRRWCRFHGMMTTITTTQAASAAAAPFPVAAEASVVAAESFKPKRFDIMYTKCYNIF